MLTAWDQIRYLETEPTARRFLHAAYCSLGIEHPERQAFQQSTRFIYTWKQARAFYRAAEESDMLVRPLLLFYGCTHLLKGVLITRDPNYPQNSRMLQHGVTTRKLKRNPYLLLEDEVRPQKEGFFAHIAKVLLLSPLQQRYSVKELFDGLAELRNPYSLVIEESKWIPVSVDRTEREGTVLIFPANHSGVLAYSEETLLQLINRLSPEDVDFVWERDGTGARRLLFPHANISWLCAHPLFRIEYTGTISFWNSTSDDLPLPAWASHFLLLYLLGMLCRYETEWWGELVLSHSYAETYLIEQFLRQHEVGFPFVIMERIQKNNTLAFP